MNQISSQESLCHSIFAERRENLRRLMHREKLTALVVSLDANRYYLSGFELHDPQVDESAGRLIIMANGNDWLCTDARYFDAAKTLWPEERIFIYQADAAKQINSLLVGRVQGSIGFEARIMTFDFYEKISKNLQMQKADGLVEELRVIKDSWEIAQLRKACSLNHSMMHWLPEKLTPGKTEAQIAWEIEQFFRNNGASELSFSSIVAVGANAALPHAIPAAKRITEECAVLVDVGCRVNDYCSDQTRSFWVGEKPHQHFTNALELIKEAQSRAIQHIVPGALCKDIYAVAKKYLDDEGVGQFFTHGLGHGIGLQTHEAPSLNATRETSLQPGMVITVEPGLYMAGHGGVRWEYMVLVTPDGAEIL